MEESDLRRCSVNTRRRRGHTKTDFRNVSRPLEDRLCDKMGDQDGTSGVVLIWSEMSTSGEAKCKSRSERGFGIFASGGSMGRVLGKYRIGIILLRRNNTQ